MSLSSVIYACFTISLFITISAMNKHQQELKEHYDHLAKIAEFECGSPQPRLLRVHELLSALHIHGKAYFPEVTVLHRCDRYVGSCNNGKYSCAPNDVTNISMPFKVTFLENMNGYVKGQWMMEYHTLENHTYCGCIKAEEKPHKTVMHYHFIDPSLMPPPKTQLNYTIPSISEMTQIAEEKVSKCNEESYTEAQDYLAQQ